MLASLAARLAQVALVGPALARAKRRAVRSIVGGVLVGLFGIFALAYLLIALRAELERAIGATWAPLAIGLGLCLFAGIAYLVFLRPRRSEADTAVAQASAVRDRFEEPARKVEAQVAKNPWQSVAIAAALGFGAAFLTRYLGQRAKRGAEPPGVRPGDGADETPPAWAREILREAERRRANGSGA